MRVHYQHIGRVHEDCGIAIYHRLQAGKCEVDAVYDILDFKEVRGGAGSPPQAARRAAKPGSDCPGSPVTMSRKNSRRETA